MELTPAQEAIVTAGGSVFAYGPPGSGKTTALQQRLLHLLLQGEPAYTMLVLIAEAEQKGAYLDFLYASGVGPYADLQITTYTALAREMVALFWPLVARSAGFPRPYQPPTILNYDLSQLLVWQIITPMLRDGAFAGLRLRPQQIVSQLIDIANRAALNRMSLDAAIDRTANTWAGDRDEIHYLHDARVSVLRFREHCRQHNLLDLSLTVHVFDSQLVEHPEFHRYFSERFRHLIVDNVEEQTAAGQLFVRSLTGKTVSTTLAYDEGGGYKWMLSADPGGAAKFQAACDTSIALHERFVSSEALTHLANLVTNSLLPGTPRKPTHEAAEALIDVVSTRYRREAVLRAPELLRALMEEGIAPSEMVIVAPYLDGALRYTLENGLRAAGVPYYLLRRRSSPRDDPRIRAWLTWLALAHPEWELPPKEFDIAEALTLSVSGLDPARAQLLADALYDEEQGVLRSPTLLPAHIAARVDDHLLAAVEELRIWLAEQGGRHPIDAFLHLLFNNLLALPPFQPRPDLAAAAVCEWLVRTAGNLREAASALELQAPADVGRTFINGIYQGLVTADPPEFGEPPDPNGVMISTVHGYLLANRVARVQVWLDAKGSGWWDVPRQPISNVFVLLPDWPPDRPWTMEEEFRSRNDLLNRLVSGLTARCSGGIILVASDLDQRGQRQDGALWRALGPLISPAPVSPEATAESF